MLSITTAELTLALLGYGIVFMVLLSLFLVFSKLPKILGSITYVKKEAQKMREMFRNDNQMVEVAKQKGVLTGQETAAIAMALHLYLYQRHDDEDVKFTIQKIKKTYSPWNSKIYGVMNRVR